MTKYDSKYDTNSAYVELADSALHTQYLLTQAAILITWYDFYKQINQPLPDDLSDNLCDFASVLMKNGYGI